MRWGLDSYVCDSDVTYCIVRYCYIPLAFACAGMVDVLLPLFASCEEADTSADPKEPTRTPAIRPDGLEQYKGTGNAGPVELLLGRFCGCVALGCCVIAFSCKSLYQLNTWRDDKAVLLNCIR